MLRLSIEYISARREHISIILYFLMVDDDSDNNAGIDNNDDDDDDDDNRGNDGDGGLVHRAGGWGVEFAIFGPTF